MTHTPGPWRFYADGKINEEPASFLIAGSGGIVALVNTLKEQGMADARLIAAAPDLLDALEAIDGMILNDDSDPSQVAALCIAIARTTLAKAKGE